MRRLFIATAALCLLLTGCAPSGAATEYDPATTAQALLDSTAFSETLEALDADLVSDLYGLDKAPLEAAVYTSTGASAEEIVVLKLADSAGADAAYKAMEARVADQTVACADYLPLEAPKLAAAMIKQAGNTVLLVVANDAAAAQAALDALH